jgi:energy-coupling factor transport system permease protein
VLGASNGLLLLALLGLFAVFNRAVSATDLLRLTPRALHHLGIVVLIALTYVPETMAQCQRIREAQAIRGYEPKGWQGWRPLLIPLLINGLERAMEVAEAMVARGYGATDDAPQSVWRQLVMVGGLAAAFLGWLLVFSARSWGWFLLGLGVLSLGWLVWYNGQQVRFTQYQAHNWHRRDTIIVGLILFPFAALFLIGLDSLFYNPLPRLTWPPFQPFFGGLLLAFLAPGFVKHTP